MFFKTLMDLSADYFSNKRIDTLSHLETTDHQINLQPFQESKYNETMTLRFLLGLTVSLSFFLGYSNCTGGSGSSRPFGLGSELDCRSGFCPSAEYVRIQLAQTLLYLNPLYPVLNVGGMCDGGGFTDNQIDWVLRIPGGEVITSKMRASQCLAGQFDFFVQLPPSFNFSLAYELEVRITAFDEYGSSYSGPMSVAVALIQPAPKSP